MQPRRFLRRRRPSRIMRCSLLAILNASCMSAGRDANAGLAGLRAEIRDIHAALVDARSELSAGGDVNQNDKWTLRLLGLGVLTLGLSYPVGKIVWLAMVGVRRRTSWFRPLPVHNGPATDDLIILSEPVAPAAEESPQQPEAPARKPPPPDE